MDKNMISIDELVRQRLSGGEERERAGAWSQMNELLDKEMPEDRMGGIYWRRAFSAVALLLLIATAGAGSYKLYNANTNGVATGDLANNMPVQVAAEDITPATNTTSISNITASHNGINTTNNNGFNKNITSNGQPSGSTRQGNMTAGIERVTGSKSINGNLAVNKADEAVAENTSAAEGNALMASTITGLDGSGYNRVAHKSLNLTGSNNRTGAIVDGDSGTAQPSAKDNETGNKSSASASANDNSLTAIKTTTKVSAPPTSPSPNGIDTRVPAAVGNNTTATSKKKIHKGIVSKKYRTKSIKPSKIQDMGSVEEIAAANQKTASTTAVKSTKTKRAITAAKKQKSSAPDKNGLTAGIAKTAKPGHKGTKTGKAKAGVAMSDLALGSNANGSALPGKKDATLNGAVAAASATVKATSIVKAPGKKTAKVNALAAAVNSTAAVAKNANKLNKAGKTKVKAAKIGAIPANDGDALATAGLSSKVPLGNEGTASMDDPEMKKLSSVNMKKNKKVIQKMELYQHLIKNNPESASAAERRYHMDTLSILTLTEDEDDNAPSSAGKRTASRNMPNVLNSAAPNAAAPLTPEEAAKIKAAKKKGSGISVMENLQSKFNDIKYNVASLRFAPGLTAGINGTFFGPNNFKGFQFGITGNFILSNTWSVMAELKYVHRINGNYSMNDDYNTYSYNQSARSYEKDSFAHNYSFSTLHSFELPVSVRYTKNNWTFFAGGNFVYTLGVNPSENPLVYQIPPVFVKAPGANTAVFTPGDLQATRFGIGYLFGFGYKIAEGMMLDLRNVQTVWDNSPTSGTRFISSQLYKSPSLQLSFMYTFGSNKEKE